MELQQLQYWVCKGTFIPNGVIVGKNEEKRNVIGQEVFEACRKPEAEAITETALYILSVSVINISHLLDPEIFVFTGGVASDSCFFERLKNKVSELSELLKEKEIPEMMISDFAGKQNGPYGPAGVAFYGILRSNL